MKRNLIVTLVCVLLPAVLFGRDLTVNGNLILGGEILQTEAGFSSSIPLLHDQGLGNLGVGLFALENNTGQQNTAVGAGALLSNTFGSYNVAVGNDALNGNVLGSYNTAIGELALIYNSGGENTAVGSQALQSNTTGSNNTAVGYNALFSNTKGGDNIALGQSAGVNVTTGNNNIEIGHLGSATDNGVIRIGTSGTQTETYIAGIHGVTVAGGASVLIDGTGHLGTLNSSARYKEDIHDMGKSSDAVMQLRPVTFRYKTAAQDGTKPLQYGLIAEEVEKVYPELIVYGQDGQVQSIQYQQLPALLLNEIQKQHRIITELTERVAALEAAQHKSAEAVTFSAH
jgi:hypothetical protein